MLVSGRVKYDGLGRAIEQYYPVTEALGALGTFNATYDSIAPTRTTYDVLDRPLTVVNPANETTSFAYGFGPDRGGQQQFHTRVTDANNIARDVFRDVDNDITSVKLLNNGGASILWTSYQYDPLDQITTVTDAANNITRAAYDNFGRRVEIDSPDSGKTAYVFDPASNLRAKITANLRAVGTQVTYNYDYNRLASISYPQHPENNATYSYGAPGAPFNQAGRLAVTTAEGGRLEQHYGPLGEVVKEIRTVDQDNVVNQDPTFTTQFRYDTWNRLKTLVYPDNETVTFEYNSGGLVEKISGQKQALTYNYLTFLGYDKFEARERVEYGNGTKTDYAYNPLNRRLSGLLAKTGTGRAFMDMAYSYDQVGNIKTLANNAQIQNLLQKGGKTSYTFQYDDLYQLTSATGAWTKPYIAAEKFTLSMSYDSIHNITRKNQYTYKEFSYGTKFPNVALTYDWNYTYASGKPHAASKVGDRTFLYDLNGNQAGWDSTINYTNRRMIWDEDNRLQEVKDSGRQVARFKYDADTNRVVKRGERGETLYVNPWYVAALGRNSKHIFAGKTRIITKLETFPTSEGYGTGVQNLREIFQYYYHPDHLGSTSYATDISGEVYQHLEYFPFGETWANEVTNNLRVPYRFTGKELDEETQLYYFGARYYDPRTSVWQSADPILGSYLDGKPSNGVFEPRNLASFSYAHQNPTVLKDADGEFVPLLILAVVVVDRAITAYEVGSDVYDYATGQKTAGQIVSERGPGYLVKLIPGGGVVSKVWRGGKWVYNKGGKYAPKIKGVWRRIRGKCSFDASTLVHTKDGLKRIDQLAVNELVFAKDEKSGKTGWKQIRDRYINKYKETVLIRIAKADGGEEEIISNRIHPFFVKDKGWLRADKLKAGFKLQTATGGWARVASVRITKKPLLAYNLEVADYHRR
jgi:RHS repeat-associated protein